jgi:hypothetical protein
VESVPRRRGGEDYEEPDEDETEGEDEESEDDFESEWQSDWEDDWSELDYLDDVLDYGDDDDWYDET